MSETELKVKRYEVGTYAGPKFIIETEYTPEHIFFYLGVSNRNVIEYVMERKHG